MSNDKPPSKPKSTTKKSKKPKPVDVDSSTPTDPKSPSKPATPSKSKPKKPVNPPPSNTLFSYFKKVSIPTSTATPTLIPSEITIPDDNNDSVEIIEVSSASQAPIILSSSSSNRLSSKFPPPQFPPGTIFCNSGRQALSSKDCSILCKFILQSISLQVSSISDRQSFSCPDLPYSKPITSSRPRRYIICGNDRKPFKLLSFHTDDNRPPFFGTMSRVSTVIRPRNPFAADPSIDYDYDSAEEWENDEDGEDLNSGEDEEDLDEKEDEDDEQFVVDDGYLSRDEGSDTEEKRTFNGDQSLVDGQKSVVIGPFFTSSNLHPPPELTSLAIIPFLKTPVLVRLDSWLACGSTPWPLEDLRLLVSLVHNSNSAVTTVVTNFLEAISQRDALLDSDAVKKKYSKRSVQNLIKNICSRDSIGRNKFVKDEIREELGLP
ncbi:hypothetical protein RCL1_003964 [Eukaryota sp. TZLM3-RCL]